VIEEAAAAPTLPAADLSVHHIWSESPPSICKPVGESVMGKNRSGDILLCRTRTITIWRSGTGGASILLHLEN
jgi:hypothetical protein